MSILKSFLMNKNNSITFMNKIYSLENAYIALPVDRVVNFAKFSVKGSFYFDTSITQYYDFIFQGKSSQGYYSTYYALGLSYSNTTLKLVNGVYSGGFSGDILSTATYGVTTINFNETANLYNNFVLNPIGNYFHIITNSNRMSKVYDVEKLVLYDNNDNILFDLIPAQKSGENGMYDNVSSEFYINSNTVGSLVCE